MWWTRANSSNFLKRNGLNVISAFTAAFARCGIASWAVQKRSSLVSRTRLVRLVMTEEISGLPTRRAALRLLDTVMRMGTPMDQATANATKGLSPPDRALAIAIAQETLRWAVDLDILIDSKTKQALPDDYKARMVLRLALAQILRLGTPAHAAIATALPLVDGGPRRLVHGGGLPGPKVHLNRGRRAPYCPVTHASHPAHRNARLVPLDLSVWFADGAAG